MDSRSYNLLDGTARPAKIHHTPGNERRETGWGRNPEPHSFADSQFACSCAGGWMKPLIIGWLGTAPQFHRRNWQIIIRELPDWGLRGRRWREPGDRQGNRAQRESGQPRPAPACARFPGLGIFVKQLEQFPERDSWTF